MNQAVHTISIPDLAVILIPVFVVIAIYYAWSMEVKNSLYSVARMLVQLLLIGYVLGFIFQADSAWIVGLVLMVMVTVSSWIALRTVPEQRGGLYLVALVSVSTGGGIILVVVTQGVLQLTPWYLPKYLIPLAGMIFANAMNAVSLGAERYFAELDRGDSVTEARNKGFRAALIPITNALFAVGLVSIPGMMTGQILSGVSPLIAARYQIMVMCMIYASSGISAAMFLYWLSREDAAD